MKQLKDWIITILVQELKLKAQKFMFYSSFDGEYLLLWEKCPIQFHVFPLNNVKELDDKNWLKHDQAILQKYKPNENTLEVFISKEFFLKLKYRHQKKRITTLLEGIKERKEEITKRKTSTNTICETQSPPTKKLKLTNSIKNVKQEVGASTH